MSYDFKTSLPAFKENNKDWCRQQVLLAIKKLGICTDKLIARELQWEINRVTPRRGELVINNLVELHFKSKDKESNRMVSYWRVRQQTVLIQQELFK